MLQVGTYRAHSLCSAPLSARAIFFRNHHKQSLEAPSCFAHCPPPAAHTGGVGKEKERGIPAMPDVRTSAQVCLVLAWVDLVRDLEVCAVSPPVPSAHLLPHPFPFCTPHTCPSTIVLALDRAPST